MEVATGCAVWYHRGKPVVPIRGGLVRQSRATPQVLLSTDQTLSALEIVRHVMASGQVDVTVEASRVPLGMGTQRQ